MALLAMESDDEPLGNVVLWHDDPKAFRSIVREHQAAVLTTCLRIVGDEAFAAEVAQETFLTLWKERARYEERGKLRAYLLGIARHRSLAALSLRKRRSFLHRIFGPKEPSLAPDLATTVEVKQSSARVRRALADLPTEREEAVRLRYLEGLSLEEISALTGVPNGTVKSRLSRGLAALKEALSHD